MNKSLLKKCLNHEATKKRRDAKKGGLTSYFLGVLCVFVVQMVHFQTGFMYMDY